MPTYQYACTECGHEFDTVQSFTDDPLKECPVCTGKLRKVFSAVGVVFKGSGFYRTDSRAKSSASDLAAKSGSSGESSGKSGSSGESSGKSGASGESGREKSTAKSESAPSSKSESGSTPAKKSSGGESAA